ncbi:MAG: AAA family ATPase [Methylotenera sp.]
MLILKPSDLNAPISLNDFKFDTTAELLENSMGYQPNIHGWVAQSEAKKAAMFGLNMQQSGFNVLVLGANGSGRTLLMQSAMMEVAKQSNPVTQLHDLVAIFDFEQLNQPTLVNLPVGCGAKLRLEGESFARALMAEMPIFAAAANQQAMLELAEQWLSKAISLLEDMFENCKNKENKCELNQYFKLIKQETLAYLKAWQPLPNSESEASQENQIPEGLINEAFFARFRVNLLVDNRHAQSQGLNQPIVYDNDPSLQSLFGGVESASDTSQLPDFTRLRAGNLHKADGGMLLLHLRDLLNDEQNGAQIVEKLHRFLRNGTLQIEDATNSAQSMNYVLANTLLPLKVKLVLIATREDFYDCLDAQPDFFDYFPIKVEFVERILANPENYAAIAGFVAQKCAQHCLIPFSREAVAALIGALQRLEEDQTRISTNFAFLERLMLESAAFAAGASAPLKDSASIVTAEHVQAAIQAKSTRNQYFEAQIRDSIIDNELLIQVHGEVVGQVNGLTHIELGDASFGSPIRITARCYPGGRGLINIDREVNMSGPTHDKGVFILQNWLSASFSHLAPLSLNASLVFEQEYSGVEGDSASCAELFALLSAMANLPIQQGIAVTGALNQFGEVMPIGGVNEKIEGYFRVCQALGLNGKQGVIIPKRNQRHLLLDSTVIDAVKNGQFHIITIDHVLEGIEYLTGVPAGAQDAMGNYAANTVMGHAQSMLASYRKTLESNQPKPSKLTND